MLPSIGGGISRGKSYSTTPSSSSSPPSKSSSTSSSSLSPFSPYARNMEEVWKDINLSSLNQAPPPPHHHHNHPHHHNPTGPFRSIILQDFLNTTAKHPPPPTKTCPPPNPPPATVLSLNSTPEFHLLETPYTDHHHLQPLPVPTFETSFDAFAAAPFLSSYGKKRTPEEPQTGTIDRRHKRMIKNRESAARSRARKQAYINELEQEVSLLAEENARLRRQQEQHKSFQAPPAATQLRRNRRGLQRTSTAPF